MKIDLSTCCVSSGSFPRVDVHRGSLAVGESYQNPLSAPGVAEALYEAACKLGTLTRNPNARVTCGNTYE
ncbi:Uncharacterised protein [uncultured archaeon]|nr:Uncharacterised protein [uncultured archaeon]